MVGKYSHPQARRLCDSWTNMKQRCYNPEATGYKRYGGRGIKVCERWQKFENFVADMGAPLDDMTLERKDNNGDYEPDNCEWVTRAAQARNRRPNVMLTHDGVTMCLKDWAIKLGLNQQTLRGRLETGWSISDAVTCGFTNKWDSPMRGKHE